MTARRTLVAALAIVALVGAACGGSDSSSENSAADSPEVSAEVSAPAGDPAAASTADCPPAEGTDTQTQQFDAPPPACLTPGVTYEAIVTTNKGEFTIVLDPESAPVAANNFVFLARNRYFDDTPCHRIIPNFVVQCGDPTGTGTGGPGYTIVDEPPAPGRYQVGSIAMAKTIEPDSAGSQFFIIIGVRRRGAAARLCAVRTGDRRPRLDRRGDGRCRDSRRRRPVRAHRDPVGPHRRDLIDRHTVFRCRSVRRA